MKLPRDISGEELTHLLKKYGYQITRQTGSHIRLTTSVKGEHRITIPNHKPLKIGTLNSILTDISVHLKMNKKDFIEELFK
jgi:predicted RNA binding protein YcfA (HicA-like mRNA interferase family)